MLSNEELDKWLALNRELNILELYRKYSETVADRICMEVNENE